MDLDEPATAAAKSTIKAAKHKLRSKRKILRNAREKVSCNFIVFSETSLTV